MRSRTSPRHVPPLAASGVVLLLLSACGYQAVADPGAAAEPTGLPITTTLHDVNGDPVGSARVSDLAGRARVVVSAHGLPPGYHGLHLHTIGLCEAAVGFVSAGGHLAHDNESQHGEHTGDLPSLFIGQDGRGSLRFTTDAFTPADLVDADGSAVMLHAGLDNFANIPSRYATAGPDVDTRKTGDAGVRIACGALTS